MHSIVYIIIFNTFLATFEPLVQSSFHIAINRFFICFNWVRFGKIPTVIFACFLNFMRKKSSNISFINFFLRKLIIFNIFISEFRKISGCNYERFIWIGQAFVRSKTEIRFVKKFIEEVLSKPGFQRWSWPILGIACRFTICEIKLSLKYIYSYKFRSYK